jgi:chitin disaccharide deacetylase
MPRLIVSADDYGLTAGVNRAIERAHLEGVVTSTSVMANQPAVAEAAGLSQRCPRMGVGIHLTLTLGKPVEAPDRIPSIVAADGSLLSRAELVARARARRIDADDVARECTAQLALLRGLGVEPDHWNAHQHVQDYVALGRPMAVAMARAGVTAARTPMRVRGGAEGWSATARQARAAPARRRAHAAIALFHGTPDALLDAPPARWAALAGRLPSLLVEALCHPGEPDEELRRLTPALCDARARELEALCSDALLRAVRERHVRLVTFRECQPLSSGRIPASISAPRVAAVTAADRSTGT